MTHHNSPVAVLCLASTLVLGACATAQVSGTQDALSAPGKTAWSHGAMVSAANPYAVDAAAAVLAAGGHAVDAAIAAHSVLGLVEPQSSGLGGGAFMLVYDYAADNITVFDGRETAPAGVREDLFIENGAVLGFIDSWQSGRSVGVPGAVALYESAHDAHGRLPWPEVFASAIALADDGFVVSPRLNNLLKRVSRVSLLDDHPASAAYFYPDGEALPVGFVRKNPDYAQTLRRISAEGSAAFYTGDLAEAIAAAAQAEPRGGTLTTDDLATYNVKIREPVCGAFRRYTICSAPPPSSGLAQIMIAGLYDRLTTAQPATEQTARVRAFVDAQRLAYADRDYYVADPDFVFVPTAELIDDDYLDSRARQQFAPDESATHGNPLIDNKAVAELWGTDRTEEAAGTTHLSIIDRYGNAVSMTASVEAPFGSSRFVGGFLLNNEMTDFARDTLGDKKPQANAAAAGKRPRSSMSPTLIFDANNNLRLVTGSPGGNSIVAYVAKTTLGILAWNQPADLAIEFPNIVARGDRVRVEINNDTGKALAKQLAELGYDVQERDGENSGLHVVVVGDDGLTGAADPRREGTVEAVPGASRQQ